MWELTVNLRDSDQASQVLSQVDDRDEVTVQTARITKYPNDRMVVARSADRAPLASLAEWGLTYSSARISLRDDVGAYPEG